VKKVRASGLVMLLLLCATSISAETIVKIEEGLFAGEKSFQNLPMSSGQRLTIDAAASLSGNIHLVAGGHDCRIFYRRKLKATSEEEAARFAVVIHVELKKTDDGLYLLLGAPDKAPWSGNDRAGRLEMEIIVPDSSKIQFNTSCFEIDATGPFAEFSVAKSLGRVRVEKVYGSTDITVSNNLLSVRDIRGRLYLSNKFGTIKMENIDAGEGGGIVRNENGEISLDTYRGELDLCTTLDKLTARRLFLSGIGNRISNLSSPIVLAFDSVTVGAIRVINEYGPISIAINGRVDALLVGKPAKGSQFHLDGVAAEPVSINENTMKFAVGDQTAEMRVMSLGSGDITIVGPDKTGRVGENSGLHR